MTVEGARVGFAGLRVAAFESRLADQMRQLIERYGGRPPAAPTPPGGPRAEDSARPRLGERLPSGAIGRAPLLTPGGPPFRSKAPSCRWPRGQTPAALGP